MASEIGLLGKRLLTSCTVRSPSLRVSQALPQPLWAQLRTLTTSSILYGPPRSGLPRPAVAGRPFNPAPTASTQTPPPPPSPGAAPASHDKSPDSPFKYDATTEKFDISKIIALETDDFMKKHYPSSGQHEPALRTRPPTGRTVHVTNNTDLARALKQLDFQCRKNKIRRLAQLQKFHERPGKKRKRLNSERWRARFKDAFKATVHRVQELKNQGW
ncbi:hypothetical protein LY78DRAFT_332067 [Colletotrichum sublineola]|nr:hypothetical protein LY78DRAFT_332067 [Colletotrichum sublineola]